MKEKTHRGKNKKSLKFVTIMLAAITLVVWLILLIYKYVTTGIDINALLDDIIANILGILPPIIIFNFVYEYISKDYVADDISEQMLETLTGNTGMMKNLKEDVRCNFIKQTIESLVGEERTTMVYGLLSPYINESKYNIRDDFQYYIDVSHYVANEITPYKFDTGKYYMVTERLSYTKHLAKSEDIPQVIRVGFLRKRSRLKKSFAIKHFCLERIYA